MKVHTALFKESRKLHLKSELFQFLSPRSDSIAFCTTTDQLKKSDKRSKLDETRDCVGEICIFEIELIEDLSG